jgi:hypothetical protein
MFMQSVHNTSPARQSLFQFPRQPPLIVAVFVESARGYLESFRIPEAPMARIMDPKIPDTQNRRDEGFDMARLLWRQRGFIVTWRMRERRWVSHGKGSESWLSWNVGDSASLVLSWPGSDLGDSCPIFAVSCQLSACYSKRPSIRPPFVMPRFNIC